MNGDYTRYLANHAALVLNTPPPARAATLTGAHATIPPAKPEDKFQVYTWKGASGISGTIYVNTQAVARNLPEAQALAEAKYGEAEDGRGALKIEEAGPNHIAFSCQQWLS